MTQIGKERVMRYRRENKGGKNLYLMTLSEKQEKHTMESNVSERVTEHRLFTSDLRDHRGSHQCSRSLPCSLQAEELLQLLEGAICSPKRPFPRS